MNAYLAVLLLMGLIVVGWRFSRPRARGDRSDRVRRPERKIEGFQVDSPLHVWMGRGCVSDLGMQYGAGFRRKEAPLLPHDPHCRCETIPFAFTASEVFGGALRRLGEPRSLEAGFPAEAIAPVIAALKRINAEPLPAAAEAYLALAAVDSFGPEIRGAVAAFLRERHAYLASQERPVGAQTLPPDGREATPFDPAPAKTP
jgi:hypothetical protein